VSTANNHALDFGVKAADQTRALLDEAGIAYCGTAATPESLYTPANLTLRGIRFAFFAVTAVMNAPGDSWKSRVASADSAILYPAIRRARETHDYVVVSFHGGDEYADSPTRGVRRFVEQTLAAGADLVIGHHPHVPYGIYSAGDKLGAYSLGNFVFKQPSRFWTQRGLALSVEVSREKSGVRTSAWHCLPVRVDFQPEFCPLGAERDTVLKRVGLFFPSEAARTYDR
jgi:poly-gamma-glutamate capsule biosynthesis protein CapA/YwtB (metallophosphatase superfamily)